MDRNDSVPAVSQPDEAEDRGMKGGMDALVIRSLRRFLGRKLTLSLDAFIFFRYGD